MGGDAVFNLIQGKTAGFVSKSMFMLFLCGLRRPISGVTGESLDRKRETREKSDDMARLAGGDHTDPPESVKRQQTTWSSQISPE